MGKGTSMSSRKSNARLILRQLFREMAIPLLLALGWTAISYFGKQDKPSVVDTISIFAGSFFLTCWASAQWFRVQKQQAVESGLGGIVDEQKALLVALAEASERLEGHASGGKSVAWLLLARPHDGGIRDISAVVVGEYTLMNATASVLDLSKAQLGVEELKRTGSAHSLFKHHVVFRCGTLQPNLAILQREFVPCDTTQPFIRFKVEWTARNGRWTQYVELKRRKDFYEFFTAVQRADDWIFENPQEIRYRSGTTERLMFFGIPHRRN